MKFMLLSVVVRLNGDTYGFYARTQVLEPLY